jgi:membrane protease YdiL (CAAX protease family)
VTGESDTGPEKRLQAEQASVSDAEHPNPPLPANLGPRGRIYRFRIWIWFAITFLPPIIFVFGFHLSVKPTGFVFTLQDELPIKVIQAFCVALATWIVARIEKRSLDDYGMPPRQAFGWRFWEGLVWGFVMLSAILLILRLSGHFQIDSVALTGAAVFKYAFGWGLVFYAVAINEEFIFRGYLLSNWSRRAGFWRGATYLSLIFGVAHLGNPGENVFGILQVVVTGMVLSFTIQRTGTLWFAVGFHAAWDWAETYFYGTPDSGMLGVGRLLNTSVQGPKWLTGGSAGPEGSIVVFFVLLLFALIVRLRFPNVRYPDRTV